MPSMCTRRLSIISGSLIITSFPSNICSFLIRFLKIIILLPHRVYHKKILDLIQPNPQALQVEGRNEKEQESDNGLVEKRREQCARQKFVFIERLIKTNNNNQSLFLCNAIHKLKGHCFLLKIIANQNVLLSQVPKDRST